jgi:hypothetical protein
MKKTELINLDNNGLAILQQTKHELERTALNLKSKLDKLTEYEALYKMKYLIDYRMQCIKDLALEKFTEKFEGSQSEKDNGFTVTLKQLTNVIYSDNVKDLESEIKALQNQLKQMKDREKKTAGRTIKGEILALTMH